MNTGIAVNGVDLGMFGFRLESTTGRSSGLETKRESAPIPGQIGFKRLTQRGLVQPRTIIAAGNQIADTRTELQTMADALYWHLHGDDLQITFLDQPDRYIVGYLANPDAIPIAPDMIQRGRQLKLTFICDDPRFLENGLQTIGIYAAGQQVPLGSTVSYPIITLNPSGGSVTAPILTYGTQHMSFPDAVIGPGSTLVIDTWNMTITYNGAAGAHLLSLDSDFISFDPHVLTSLGPPWPTISIAPGLGAYGCGTAVYKKAWRS